jgi:hypothetical protein
VGRPGAGVGRPGQAGLVSGGVEGLVEALSAGIGAAAVVGEASRRFWRRREVQQQAAFRKAVQQIVDESVADVIARQAQFERRQGQHLDRQDRAIAELRKAVDRRR